MAQQAPTADDLQKLQDQIDAQQQQITQQQQQLELLKAQARQAQAQADKASATAQQIQTQASNASSMLGHGVLYKSPGVTLTMGGFIEAASIDRDHNEEADVGSSYSLSSSGIPLPISELYHSGEFRESARQSRLSFLAQGDEDYRSLAAYFEFDFLGAAPTANSKESNSYNLRIRHVYATYDDRDDGFHFLGGQTWSLLTQDKVGIQPRTENIPLTIDAQYVVGFNWDRTPQLRVVKDFGPNYHLGLSAESPQATCYNGGAYANTAASLENASTASNVQCTATGGSLLSGAGVANTFSLDQAPDVIAKFAADPGWGHYELIGLARFFHDETGTAASGASGHDTMGWGVGANAILPIAPKQIDLSFNLLYGDGIGRYGSAQFSDTVVNPVTGALDPLPTLQGMVGVVGHPTDALDLYAYGGLEEVRKTDVMTIGGLQYGYGNPAYVNSGCSIAFSAAGCAANFQQAWQIQPGFWWKWYQGKLGFFETGASYSYTHAAAFSGVGGAPSTDENIFMVSFRYYPF